MERSALAILVAASCLVTACVPKSRAGATATTVAGAAMAVAGGMMLADLSGPGEDTDGNGRDDFNENVFACIFGCPIAAALLAAGAGLAAMGLVGLGRAAETEAPPDVRVAMPPAIPTAVASIDPRIVAPLPELAADAETIRLAQQARGAVRDGHCDAARLVVDRIWSRHPEYARALATGPVLAPCPESAPGVP
jgi:hypothetical protein